MLSIRRQSRIAWNALLRPLVVATVALSLPALALAESFSKTVEVVAVVKPELALTIEPETGQRIDLGTVYSSHAESRDSGPVRVNVSVFSNLGSSYHVTQELVAPMANEDGTAVPPGSLLVTPDGSGAALPADRQQVVFTNARGEPASGTVTYQLRIPPRQDAGTYRSTVLMTVTAQ